MNRRASRRITAFLDGEDRPDIPNPIHSTGVARQYGFAGPLVGGVTVYGWLVPPILDLLGDAWLESGWADVRFRRPVYPGDDLEAYPVSTLVNSPHNDRPECIEPLGPP